MSEGLVDVSKPTHLSPRAAELVAKQERLVRVAQQRIHAIVDHDRKYADEDDAATTARLRRYRTRQGKAQVRYHLTGDRKSGAKSNQALRAFRFIYRRCKDSGFRGTEIAVAEIAEHLGVKPRQAQYILDRLENHTPHRALALRGPKLIPGIIVRLPCPGRESRFAISLPESNEFLKELRDTFERNAAEAEVAETVEQPLLAA
jgi:DNA-binding MarR family transcriptional regulator